jgi:ribosomal protein S18 acetylase RimI-like enzyme
MMDALHSAARLAGAKEVELRVHRENLRAIALYTSMGYTLSGDGCDGQSLYRRSLVRDGE